MEGVSFREVSRTEVRVGEEVCQLFTKQKQTLKN